MVTRCPSHTLSKAPTGRAVRGKHVPPLPRLGSRSRQPSLAAALGLRFPSCEMGLAEVAPKAPTGSTVHEGLG